MNNLTTTSELSTNLTMASATILEPVNGTVQYFNKQAL